MFRLLYWETAQQEIIFTIVLAMPLN
jgi:hypothetical protein